METNPETIQNSKETNQQEQCEPFILKENNNNAVYVLFKGGYRRILKDVVEMRKIEVSPKCYSTIRSFVESSSSSKYPWNIGIATNNKIYFVKPYRWILIIGETGIELIRYKDRTTVLHIPNRDTNTINICGHEIALTEEIVQLSTVIVSSTLFAKEIPLSLIMDKIREYINI